MATGTIGLFLHTVLVMFVSVALVSGLIVGAVHAVFNVMLLWYGIDTEGRLESIRKRRTSFQNQHSGRQGFEYEMRISYYCSFRRNSHNYRVAKMFTSKNWDAFHDVEAGRFIPIRIWPRVCGWAALRVDVPSWNRLVVVGALITAVYGMWLKWMFLSLFEDLRVEGVDEGVSRRCIIGVYILLTFAYTYITLKELVKTEVTIPQSSEVYEMSPIQERNSRRGFAGKIQQSLSRFVRNLESETYSHPSPEMRAMLPERRTGHSLV